jgi:hypothetical protein
LNTLNAFFWGYFGSEIGERRNPVNVDIRCHDAEPKVGQPQRMPTKTTG